MSDLSQKALQIALTQIGKREDPIGSNWGTDAHPEVRNYLESVGIDLSASWCMAFMYWAFEQAALQLGVTNPLTKTGGVLRQWNKHPDKRQKTPASGDIFIMDFGHGLGHTGLVERVEDNIIITVEGNSNTDGSRNGYEVVNHSRGINNPLIKGYLRF